MPNNQTLFKANGGQAALTAVIFFLFISLAVVFGAAAPALKEMKISKELLSSKESYFFSEGALEDASFRVFSGKNMPSELVYSDGLFRATTTVSDIIGAGADTKEITVSGAKTDLFRKLKSVLVEDTGAAFNYASQVGDLGLKMFSNAAVNGNVFSNGDIIGYSNSVINGDALTAGVISSPSPQVTGVKTEGVSPVDLPPLDVDYWKAQANINNDPLEGNKEYNSGSHALGPKKINGNLTLNNQAELTVTGALHITGNLEMNNNSMMDLTESFAADGLVIIVDGFIHFNSNSEVYGTTALPKGYLVFISLNESESAIELNSNAEIEGVIYATNGWVVINSNGEITAVAGRGVLLDSNAELNYDLGLRDIRLTGGPSGGWKVKNWREIP